jgi:hypothetical protein
MVKRNSKSQQRQQFKYGGSIVVDATLSNSTALGILFYRC